MKKLVFFRQDGVIVCTFGGENSDEELAKESSRDGNKPIEILAVVPVDEVPNALTIKAFELLQLADGELASSVGGAETTGFTETLTEIFEAGIQYGQGLPRG